jgi:MscS family membrane protein
MLVNSVVVFAFGWILLRLKNGLIAHLAETSRGKESALDSTTLQAISKLLSIAIVIFILVLLHDVTGMSLTTFLAFGGVGGLALAFASQEIFSNFFGGLMIHITRPFSVGENIFLPTYLIDGVIEEIGWYQTRVRALSKAAVYVPNSLFSKALLVNKSRITHRLIEDTLSFSIYPLASTSTILEDATKYLSSHPSTDKTEWAGARIASFNGPICNITVTAVLTTESLPEYYRIRDQIRLQIGEIISSHGGILSYPHIGF